MWEIMAPVLLSFFVLSNSYYLFTSAFSFFLPSKILEMINVSFQGIRLSDYASLLELAFPNSVNDSCVSFYTFIEWSYQIA